MIKKSILLCSLLLLTPSWLLAANYAKLDGIVAVVNDDLVMRSELRAKIKQIQLQSRGRGGLPPKDVLEQKILEQLIQRRLQVNAAKKSGIAVDDAVIDKALNSIAQRNHLTLAQLKQVLAREGINFNRFKSGLEEEYLVSRLRNKILAGVQVSEHEINAHLAKDARLGDSKVRYKVGYILIAVPDGAESRQLVEVRKKAEAVAKDAQSGRDFRQLAMKHSNAENALKGGDLGWMQRSQLPSAVARAVLQLGAGEVSQALRGRGGFYIVKLYERKGSAAPVMIKQTRARHILIRTNEIVSEKDAKTRLEQLRSRILGGEDFGRLARGHSNDTGSAVKGGELGWVNPGDVVPAFQQQMDALGINEISKPFKSQFGWHIVQVLERRSHDSSDKVRRNKAMLEIRERKAKEAVAHYLSQLRDEAYVEIRLNKPGYQ